MKQDLISVVIPCYNVEKFLDDCFAVIKAQTYKNIEVIFVNDGSKDNTLSKIKTFCETDKRYKYVDQKNRGASGARNAGVEAANGKYVYFMDSDDLIHPEILRVLYKNIFATKSDCSVCGLKVVNEHLSVDKMRKRIKKDKTIELNDPEEFMAQYLSTQILNLSPCNKLYKMEILKKLENFPNVFDEEIKMSEDVLFNVKYLSLCKKICFTKTNMYFYRQRKNSIMHSSFKENSFTIFKAVDECIEICEKSFPKAVRYAQTFKGVACIVLLDRILKSDYSNYEKINQLYKDLKGSVKYAMWAKLNPWYRKYFMFFVVPYFKLMLSLKKRNKK